MAKQISKRSTCARRRVSARSTIGSRTSVARSRPARTRWASRILQKTAAESNEVLHGFNSVVGMGEHVNGNSDGPRIQNVEIKGPFNPTGVSETPSRRKIFSCMPKSTAEEQACAEQILSGMARKAFRRPVTSADLNGALTFYKQGHAQGGFETGIQKGLMAILVSPKFLYRAHTPPAGAEAGQTFRINDIDLASRLSFFLWSRGPDETLIQIAAQRQAASARSAERAGSPHARAIGARTRW